MDIQPQTTQAMSDDQELAKVLAGVTAQVEEKTLDFEQTPAPTPMAADPAPAPEPAVEEPTAFTSPASVAAPADLSAPSGDLESIKKQALGELRPLVDKLDLAPDEKFDTYLLLLRSTDDQALIAPAYAAAQAITDESRKAQALLDVIKEIDYLSTPKA
jgi:hypothetical protein